MRRPRRRRASSSKPPASSARDRRTPADGARTLFEISAGGVIYRRTDAGIAVCLIATKGGTRWQLPKGKREDGESLEQTAAREVAEETGLVGAVGLRLDKIDLWFTWTENGVAVRHHKIVYFYLLEYLHGSTADHDDEVEDARWFDAEDALTRLTFPNERKVVARALEHLTATPAPARQRSR